MNITIHQTYGRIGIDTIPAQISIKSPEADLKIKQTPAKMEINQKLPQVHIDQYQCFYESGLKNIFDLVHDEAVRSREIGLEAIGKIVDDGDRLAAIENHQNVIQLLAVKTGTEDANFNVDLMPKSRPKIWFDGYININWNHGVTDINVTTHKPEISATPGNINIYMREYPSIKIDYVGNSMDRRV